MLRNHLRIEKRAAFTLIELMIVVLIIAILVSMLLTAVAKALARGAIVENRVEIGQMEAAIQTLVQTYRIKFVPSRIKLSETNNYPQATTVGTDDYNSVQFLKRMFPRIDFTIPHDWNRDGTIADGPNGGVVLLGPECLVFFLGGPANQGFSANPADPADKRSLQPPAFEFKTSRLIPSQFIINHYRVFGYNVYQNNYGRHAQPYLYFTSYYQGNDYVNDDCFAYHTANGTQVLPYVDPNTGRYINPNTFQIISAGAKGVYGGGYQHWNPKSGSTDPATADNQANFAPGLLVAGE